MENPIADIMVMDSESEKVLLHVQRIAFRGKGLGEWASWFNCDGHFIWIVDHLARAAIDGRKGGGRGVLVKAAVQLYHETLKGGAGR